MKPQTEGNAIRIAIPPPSAKRRQQLIGQVKKMTEEARVSIRNERRDANKLIDKLAKDKTSHLSEDGAKDAKDDVEKLTKEHVDKIDQTSSKKVSEIEKD